MLIVIQRVKKAKVTAEETSAVEIGPGFLLLAGIAKQDTMQDIDFIAKKTADLRVFADEKGKMNLNIIQVNGQILSIPQFTLFADTGRGNRPGFDAAAEPVKARQLWMEFNQALRDRGVFVKEGMFGANMQVELVNDGPVTIILDSRRKTQDARHNA